MGLMTVTLHGNSPFSWANLGGEKVIAVRRDKFKKKKKLKFHKPVLYKNFL